MATILNRVMLKERRLFYGRSCLPGVSWTAGFGFGDEFTRMPRMLKIRDAVHVDEVRKNGAGGGRAKNINPPKLHEYGYGR